MARHRAPARPHRLQRLRALLAGGLVLGIGAAVTLAAWTDQEYASSGTFTASIFGTESSVDRVTWTSHDTSGNAATLTFNATAMSPGALVYASINIRTTATTNVGGTVSLVSETNDAETLLDVLEYRAVRTASVTATCDATAFTTGSPTYIVGDGTPTYVSITTVPGSPVASTITVPGGATPELRFCFEVQLPSGTANSYQGTTGTVTWLFSATST
jgi:predicted ribosomally synthesized peptide with SipW-like signal peptide